MIIGIFQEQSPKSLARRRSLNIRTALMKRPGRLLSALCTFDLFPMFRGEMISKVVPLEKYCCVFPGTFPHFSGQLICRNISKYHLCKSLKHLQ